MAVYWFGRGGLPRCWNPDLHRVSATRPGLGRWYRRGKWMAYSEDEIDWLKEQAQAMREGLASIEKRVEELQKAEA